MKNEKKSYLIPCADIVDIRMEGSLLQDSEGGYGHSGGEEVFGSDTSGGYINGTGGEESYGSE